MDLQNILNQIEQVDPEVYERLSPRRHILKSFGSKVAVAALPLAIGSLFKKAYGKTTSTATDVLNFALQLEYLEYNFYQMAINTTGLIPTADLGGIDKIRQHEMKHVDFLKGAIAAAGTTPYTPATNYSGQDYSPSSFSFTAGNVLPDYFGTGDYATFLVVAQAFEDTGVRAYKGQAGNLQATPDFLLAALQIHSAEARHASHIRLLRRTKGDTTTKPWITGISVPSALIQANYQGSTTGSVGEDNTTQLGVNITSLPAVSGTVATNAATESFDEPLDKAAVLGLVGGFYL